VRRTAAGVLAGALALSGAVATAVPANAAAGFALERIAGEGRYETSAAIAREFIRVNAGAVTNVILASGESTNTPDALAASFLAGVQNAPVVLTQRSTTPGATREVLATLRTQGATTLTVVGGPAAVAEEQITALRALGWTVNRVGGANRYETAANIATAGEGATASNVGLLASGTSTIDALAGGPVAFKGRHPLFLTTRDGIPGAIVRSMRANGVTSVYILGGEAVVSPRVVAQLAANNITVAGRLAGADRSATSVAIANAVIGGTFGFTDTTFNVASGINGGVDALGGAALSGKQNRVLLVTNNAGSAAPIEAFATARAAQLTAVGNIFGGTTVVSAALEERIERAGGGGGTNNQAFATTVTGTATVELGGDAASRTRTFTAAVPAGTAVDIQLFNAANVIRAANGAITFVDADRNNVADPGTVTSAAITTVNGAPFTAGGSYTSSGTITFTVTGGTTNEAVVPVLFVDANGDNQLNLVAPTTANADPKAPSEQFSVGPVLTFVPQAAALGSSTPTVASVTADQDFFIGTVGGSSFTYRYDANDVFQYQGVAITLAQFESLLSSGDALQVAFSPTAAGISTFNVTTDAAPTAVATATATVSSIDGGAVANDVRVTYTRPATNAPGATYVLERRAAGAADTTFTAVTTATQAAGTGTGVFVFTDLNVPNGTYVYRVSVTNPVSGTRAVGGNTADVVVPAAADTTRPTAVFSATRNATGLSNTLDTGDVINVVFSEVLAAPTAGDLIRLRDADGTIVDVINGTNATFTLNTAAQTVGGSSRAAGTTLTITLTATPTGAAVVGAGTTAGLQLPADIIDQAGNVDPAGNAFNPGGGGDVTVNVVADLAS
jgi:putative cell wall-binding protein